MHNGKDEYCSVLEYAERLISELLSEPEVYFSRGYLNSEGWKKVGVVSKVLARRGLQIRKALAKIRSNPSYEVVTSMLQQIMAMLRIEAEKACSN